MKLGGSLIPLCKQIRKPKTQKSHTCQHTNHPLRILQIEKKPRKLTAKVHVCLSNHYYNLKVIRRSVLGSECCNCKETFCDVAFTKMLFGLRLGTFTPQSIKTKQLKFNDSNSDSHNLRVRGIYT